MSGHIHRQFTVAEVAEADRCLACGGAPRASAPLAFAEGASTLHMTCTLPDVTLCDDCFDRQRRAMGTGRAVLVVAMLAPVFFVGIVAATTPLDTPLALPGVCLAALIAAYFTVEAVRRARARAACVLYVDGSKDRLVLQLPARATTTRAAGYREPAREVPEDERVAKTRVARVRATLALLGSSVLAGGASYFAWFGAYPIVVLHNPTGVDIKATIDRTQTVTISGRQVSVALPWGKHRIVFTNSATPVDIDLGFGRNLLVSADPAQCYEVFWHAPATARSPARMTTVKAFGPVVAIDDPGDVVPGKCPAPPP